MTCLFFCRDLKPANILITKTRQVKVADFGFAVRVLSQYSPTHKYRVFSSKQFKNTTFCGTPNYMAPEILKRRGPYDALPTDIWSLYVDWLLIRFIKIKLTTIYFISEASFFSDWRIMSIHSLVMKQKVLSAALESEIKNWDSLKISPEVTDIDRCFLLYWQD